MINIKQWYYKYGLSDAPPVQEEPLEEGMTSIYRWKKLHEEDQGDQAQVPAVNNETGPPQKQDRPDEQWEYLKQMFGQDRNLVDPSLKSKMETQPLGSLLPKVLAQYQGDKNEAAKELIAALLKIVFGDQAGSGQAVSAQALSNNSDTPLGNAVAAPNPQG